MLEIKIKTNIRAVKITAVHTNRQVKTKNIALKRKIENIVARTRNTVRKTSTAVIKIEIERKKEVTETSTKAVMRKNHHLLKTRIETENIKARRTRNTNPRAKIKIVTKVIKINREVTKTNILVLKKNTG